MADETNFQKAMMPLATFRRNARQGESGEQSIVLPVHLQSNRRDNSRILRLKSDRRVTALVFVLLTVFFANQFANEWQLFRSGTYPEGDFPHYYVAAKLARSHPAPRLYYPANGSREAVFGKIPADTDWGRFVAQNGLSDTLHFSAPPLIATLLSPLGNMSINQAFLVWRLLSTVFFFAGICFCLQLCGALTPINVLVCTLAGFTFQPFTLTLDKGQFGAVLLLLWAAGTYCAGKRQDLLSAFLFALATIVKLTPVLAIGLFVIRRRWRWLIAYVCWITVLLAIGVWHLGLENHLLYLSKLQSLSHGVPGPYNYSLVGIIQNAYYGNVLNYEQMPADPPALLNAVGKVCQLALYVGVLIFLVRRNKRAEMTWDLTALSLVILIAAPFTWRHYYVLLLLPVMFVWFNIRHFSRRWALGTFLSSLLIAGTRYPDFLQTHLSNGPSRVLLVSLLPLSAIALLAVLLFAYRNEGELH